ncbi:hypothetical protein D3C73_1240020 [compost metagenome]
MRQPVIEADIEGLLVIDAALDELLFALRYISAVFARHADVIVHLLFKRLGEIFHRPLFEAVDDLRIDTVPGHVQKACLRGCSPQGSGGFDTSGCTVGKQSLNVDQRQGLERGMRGNTRRGRHK